MDTPDARQFCVEAPAGRRLSRGSSYTGRGSGATGRSRRSLITAVALSENGSGVNRGVTERYRQTRPTPAHPRLLGSRCAIGRRPRRTSRPARNLRGRAGPSPGGGPAGHPAGGETGRRSRSGRTTPAWQGSPENVQGKPTATALDLRNGPVWQAEEIRVTDGAAITDSSGGKSSPGCRPRRSISPATWNTGWYEISRDLDGRLIAGDAEKAGGPLPMRGGPAQPSRDRRRGARATWPERPGAPRRRLDPGLPRPIRRRPPVRRSVGEGPSRSRHRGRRSRPARARCYRSDAVRALRADGDGRGPGLDLRDLFDLDRPGRYRVDLLIDDIRTEEGKPACVWRTSA